MVAPESPTNSDTTVATMVNKSDAGEDMDCITMDEDKDKDTVMVTQNTVSSVTTLNTAEVFSKNWLQMYYSRLFPYDLLSSWLHYGKLDLPTFTHREFSFTLATPTGEEIYIRYQSFETSEKLRSAILDKCPVKIDIGAVYSKPPRDKDAVQTGKSKPTQRELVFDIDLTDYDDIRQCGCDGAKICRTCWKFMPLAIHTIDNALRQDFGFCHIAWFYSGRRGVHAWVCDTKARMLEDAGRSAVAKYLSVYTGNDNDKEVSLGGRSGSSYGSSTSSLHPHLQRSIDYLEPYFVKDILTGHHLFDNAENWTKVLDTLPETDTTIREELLQEWNKRQSTPEQKWNQLKKRIAMYAERPRKANVNKSQKTRSESDGIKLKQWLNGTILRYCYPRLDINVSKMRNHLLKSPFCVHPKTGRVCVPIETSKADDFDPMAVPTLSQLMQELNDNVDAGTANGKSQWQNTSLKKYFDPFKAGFLDPLLKEMHGENRNEAEQRGDF